LIVILQAHHSTVSRLMYKVGMISYAQYSSLFDLISLLENPLHVSVDPLSVNAAMESI